MTLPSRHIGVSIDCPAPKAYAFASNPANLPRWATGLGAVREIDNKWIADMDIGRVTIVFAKRNDFGILDHNVTLPDGKTFSNPMRVLPNGNGCEVIFTLFRQPETSDEAFGKDALTIAKDLETLKELLERA